MRAECARFLIGTFAAACLLLAGPLRAKEPAAGRVSFIESYGKMPIYFVQNRGQLDRRVSYYVPGNDTTVIMGNGISPSSRLSIRRQIGSPVSSRSTMEIRSITTIASISRRSRLNLPCI